MTVATNPASTGEAMTSSRWRLSRNWVRRIGSLLVRPAVPAAWIASSTRLWFRSVSLSATLRSTSTMVRSAMWRTKPIALCRRSGLLGIVVVGPDDDDPGQQAVDHVRGAELVQLEVNRRLSVETGRWPGQWRNRLSGRSIPNLSYSAEAASPRLSVGGRHGTKNPHRHGRGVPHLVHAGGLHTFRIA